MGVSVAFKGLDKVHRLYADLPANLDKEIMRKSLQFSKSVQKSAKLMAPRSKGDLARNIKVRRLIDRIILSVNSPWALQQETGKGLPHYMPMSLVKTTSRKSKKKKGGDLPPKQGMAIARGYTPFMFPALEKNIGNLPNMMDDASLNAINKSKGG